MTWATGLMLACLLLVVIYVVAEVIRFGPREDEWREYRQDELRRKIERNGFKMKQGIK